ncbi:MAG: zinc D-Ala-D-Ala dipeptidase [Verrucomicrobiota bacterium]|jgi:D-alanyl-D-alanine dipeptidase
MTLTPSAFAVIIGFAAFSECGIAQDKIRLVDIKSADPTIVVDLRYAGTNNVAGRRLYPKDMPAFIRPEIVPRLRAAQKFLRSFDYRLKIWDAYRPEAAQKSLWRAIHNSDYVADPEVGPGSMHTWGIAVDCTLVDTFNRPVAMPTDFDNFTPAAMSRYSGTDRAVRNHLRLLQVAMAASGFYGFRSEWWHFTVKDWPKFLPPEEAKRVAQLFGSPTKGVP